MANTRGFLPLCSPTFSAFGSMAFSKVRSAEWPAYSQHPATSLGHPTPRNTLLEWPLACSVQSLDCSVPRSAPTPFRAFACFITSALVPRAQRSQIQYAHTALQALGRLQRPIHAHAIGHYHAASPRSRVWSASASNTILAFPNGTT
jgi:hypothetical protein